MLHGPAVTADILSLADRPDVVVFDCMMTAAHAAARQLGVPRAALVHVMYGPFVHEWGDGVLHTDVAGMLADVDQVLVSTPYGLDTATVLPDNTSYVGAITAPDVKPPESFDLDALNEPGDPWVLLSLSTTLQKQDQALPAILDALAALPVRVLLTHGGVRAAEAIPLPVNVTARSYVPHESVLAHMRLVICHGGLSTVTTALAHGVPLVCIPQGREQPINAAQVQACGAGHAVPAEATVTELREAVQSTLADRRVHARAAQFANPNAGVLAVTLVEQLARAGAPSRRATPTRLGSS